MILAISSSLVVWALFSRKLESLNISAAMAFVLAGLVLASWPAAVIDIQVGGEMLRSIAEVTLALLLFSDAARVNVGVLRQDRRVPMRLLMLGLPLTLGLGVALAVWLFPDLNPWAAAAIAAAVAPTDAALGAQVVEDTHVPLRIRRILNVESGLNDGIATPFVSFFVAGAVADTASQSSVTLGGAIADLAIGVLTGIAIGLGGGILLRYVRRLGWSSDSYRGIGVLALALVAYSASIQFGGNGFIGAFVGGLAFGSALPSVKEQDVTLGFDAQSGGFLSLVVWFLFGAAMLPALEAVTWRTVLFVVLALTVVRMVPVAIALVGSGLTRTTIAFVGWFGPRGLASVVFGVLAFDSLEEPDATPVLAAVTLTVLVSVVAHGFSAAPLSRRFGRYVAGLPEDAAERQDVPGFMSRSHGDRHRPVGPGESPRH